VAADPNRAESYVLLSEFLTSQYRLVDAARVLMKARAVNKSSYEIYRGFARIELYRKNYKAAVRNAEQALQIYSSDVESLVIMIKSLKAMGELEKAYAHARAAKEVSKSSFDLENLYSELMMKTQGLAVAKGYIEERLRTTSGDPKYRVIMANLYLEDQQYAAAAQTAKRGNDLLEWELVEGVVTYAKALGELKKLESAVDMFEKAYLMKPTDATPLFMSGEMLLNNFKPRDAIKQFERVERANPLYPDLLYQWAKSKKMIAQKENDAELAQEAIKLAEKELDRDPTHFESHILIAEAYYVLGNIIKEKVENTNPSDEEYSFLYSEMVSWYKLCASNYQKAIDKAVQPGDVHISMARCYRLSGALDQARASADYAEKIDKTNPRVWLELALIHEQQGSFRLALKSYENFLLIYPNAENKKEVENRINKLKSIAEEN
jgi:tetratricopeptide (TPR) repeat protein